MKTKALLAGIGSLFFCLNAFATTKNNNGNAASAGCPTITVTISKQVNVSCNGGSNGSAIATASGGATPYTYNWTPSGGTKDTASNLTAGNYTVTATDKNGCTGMKKVVIVQPNVLKDNPAVINVKCFGGATGVSTAVASGGTPAYKYSWSTGSTNSSINNLVAGTYTITVTDKNSCVNTATITVTQPATAITATVTTTPESCNGGSNGTATATASGGTPSYTYKWNNTATTQTIINVASNTYTCTVKDANGCSVMASANISQPTAITFAKTVTYPGCNKTNGSIAVTVSGGTTAYTYSWLPSGGTGATASSLGAGSYTLNVTDGNGCPASLNTLLYNSGIIASTVVTNVTCYGSANGSVTTSLAGGMAPYTYSWAPSGATTSSLSSLSPSSYTVTITDKNGCQGIARAAITQPALLRDSIASSTNIKCNGSNTGSAKVGVKGGTVPYKYSWAPSGGTAATASNLGAGTYTCTITDKDNCTGTATVTITQPAAPLSASVSSSSSPLCNGNSNGSAAVTVSGGTTPYTYKWTPSGGTKASASNLAGGTYTCTVTDKNNCTSAPFVTLTNPPLLTANISSSTNPSCAGGGSATVTAGGGTTPYTYSWAPSGGTSSAAVGLVGGTYTATVTDANLCTATATVTLTSPSSLAANITATVNPTCSNTTDGSITVSTSGGTTPYSYSWAPSGGTNATASNLGVGTYTLTVTDNGGCKIIKSITLATSAVTAAINTSSNPLCNSSATGSATVTSGGGTTPYTYNWTPSGGTGATASNLTAGAYTVTVSDNHSCTTTATVTLTDPPLLTATISSSHNPLCNGDFNGSAVVSASGGTTGYTYSWALAGGTGDTATGLNAGTYTATVTDANLCTATATVTLTDPAVLTASISSSSNPKCNGSNDGNATVTAGGGTTAYTYSWTPSGGTGATANGLVAGNYTVTVTDANLCAATATVALTDPAVLTASIASSSNPKCNGSSDGSATVIAGGGTTEYTYSWTPSGGTNVTASGLSAGNYTVTVTDANLCSATATVSLTDPAVLTANISSSTNILCHGSTTGSATVTAGGGTTAYAYSWSPSGGTNATANGLGAGGYTVTVTDANSCLATATVMLTEPSPLMVISTTKTNASCGKSNGAASVVISGGVTSYTYAWTPSGGTNSSASNLGAGTYTCTVTDANNCNISPVVIVKDSTTLAASILSSVNETCNSSCNGKAFGKATGGISPYTYNWSPTGGTNDSATALCAGLYNFSVTDNVGCTASDTIRITQPAVIVITITPTPASCFGTCNGSEAAVVTGGTFPYVYSWNTVPVQTTANAGGLCTGTYTVIVTDKNGCTGNSNGAVTQPTVLSITGTSLNATCFGTCNGQATITPSGGTTPYSYSWNNGATAGNVTGLCAGSYTCIVTDANGCTHDTIINISEPTVITATVTATSANCGKSDGSANIVASGGTGAYTYSWAPSGGTSTVANNLAAGTYTCNVTDANSCLVLFTVNVNNNSSLKDTVTSHINVTCNGLCNGSAVGSASGGTTPYTYAWSPSGGTNTTASSLCANSYNFTVTDNNGCVYINSVTITQPASLTVVIDSAVNISCTDTIWAVVGGGVTPYTYSWNTGATTSALNGICTGSYTVTVTDSNGCTQLASIVIVATGIQELSNVSDVKVYPNPTSGELNILINNQNIMPQAIVVYDITGRKVIEQKADKNTALMHMDVSALFNGTYILEINGLNGTKIVRFTVGK
jgi:hypothetical protein